MKGLKILKSSNKKILVIMAAGKSSRFPNMKPKYLLTHPDGRMMIEHVVDGIDTAIFDDVYILIRDEHDEKFGVTNILSQALPGIYIYKISDSDSPVETIKDFLIFRSDIPLVTIKDCDCVVGLDYEQDSPYIGGLKVDDKTQVGIFKIKVSLRQTKMDLYKALLRKR